MPLSRIKANSVGTLAITTNDIVDRTIRSSDIALGNVGYNIELLMFGGGGGGGGGFAGGGGGGGGCVYATYFVIPGVTYVVAVGAGGGNFSTGADTSFYPQNFSTISDGSIVAYGGGRGGNDGGAGPDPGGCGGGGTWRNATGKFGAIAYQRQGFNGGRGTEAIGYTSSAGAGGGGTGGSGGDASSGTGGTGGAASATYFRGSAEYFGAGGGGGGNTAGAGGGYPGTSIGGAGGAGTGGSSGSSATAGRASGGGGGGANGYGAGGSGSAGILFLRYLGSQRGTGGTVTTSGNFTIHSYTGTSTFVA